MYYKGTSLKEILEKCPFLTLLKHPLISEAVVLLKNDHNGNNFLVGYYVSQKELEERELISYLKEKIPEYMLPSVLLAIEKMPITENGKIDRKKLPQVDMTSYQKKVYIEPHTSVEKQLAEIWTEILGEPLVGLDDDYFSLGGDSLMATQLNTKIRSQFNIEIGLENIFSNPTLKEQATAISRKMKQKDGIEKYAQIIPNKQDEFECFPLTEIQQAYWMGRYGSFKLGDTGTHFFSEFETENIDVERLERAWNKIIQRHGMMRTIILEEGAGQITLREVEPYKIKLYDCLKRTSVECEECLNKIRLEMAAQEFDVYKWPLFDIRACLLPMGIVHIFISFDSIVLDGWSMIRFLKEWSEYYLDEELMLPKLDLTFRDYVLALDKLKSGKFYHQDLEYWETRMEQMAPPPELPLKRLPEQLTVQKFMHREGRLSRNLWETIKSKSKDVGVTPSAVLLTVYALILNRWSTCSEFTINLTHFNRLPLHPQIDKILGDFTTLTLLSLEYSTERSFEAQCKLLQQQLWKDLDHSLVCGVTIQRKLSRNNREKYRNGFPIVFTSALGIQEGLSGNILGDRVGGVTQTPQVWLDHQVIEDNGELLFAWDSVDELFPDQMLDQMFEAYCKVLTLLAENVSSWKDNVGEIIEIPNMDRRNKINATEIYQRNVTLSRMFAEQVSKMPDKAAIVLADRNISYLEADRISNGIAEWLLNAGVCRNELVALVMEKGWEQIVGVLGVLKAGAAYLPIDANLPQSRINMLLTEGNVRFVLTQPSLNILLDELVFLVLKIDDRLRDREGQLVLPEYTGDSLAYVIYTSGSTGKPKGVMITHDEAVNTILDINRKFGVDQNDRILALSNLNFDLSVYDIFGMLSVGGAIVIPETKKSRDPQHWIELIVKEGITIWNTVPALMKILADTVSDEKISLTNCMKLILLSGDWVPVTLPPVLHSIFTKATVVALGGATEASIWSNYFICDDIDPEWNSIPYGIPLANQKYFIMDENMHAVPDWVPGELYIGGKGVAEGYYGDENLTAQKFVFHPLTGERIYRTGDFGRYWPNGVIEFLGRIDSQVKINGYRIELGEIEAHLKSCVSVKDAIVCSQEIEGRRILVGYIILTGGENLSREYFEKFLKEVLPDYMVPRTYVFLDEIPLTANGKVAYEELPLPTEKIFSKEYVPPVSEVEKVLAGIWERLFKMERIGCDADFFEEGGDSLQAIQLATSIKRTFNIEIGLDSVLKNPCLKNQALVIEKQLQEGKKEKVLPQIVADKEHWTEEFPLTDVQQAYWVGRKGVYALGDVSTKYYFEIEGESLEISKLEVAWNSLIKRHGMMRTIILPDGEHQKTLSNVPYYEIVSYDLTAVDADTWGNKVKELRQEMFEAQFDTGKWPLFDLKAVRLPLNKVRLHISFDNIVFDGWSMTQFLDEWATAYFKPDNHFSELDISFRDYMITLEKIKETDIYQEDLKYWKGNLPEIMPAPELPLACKPEQLKKQVFTHREHKLNEKSWRNIQNFAKDFGITASVVLMTAYTEILHRWSRKSEFTLNLTQFNRLPIHEQIDNLVGDFTSIILLSLDHSKGCTFIDHAQNMQEKLWSDMSHSYVSGIWVQRELIKEYGDEFAKGFPVVFTSALGTTRGGKTYQLGKRVFGSSQTPQVWLDNQVMVENEELLFSWDAVEELFPKGMLDDMFKAYCTLLEKLSESRDMWKASRNEILELPNLEIRRSVNNTYTPRKEQSFISLFEESVLKVPDQVAISTDGIVLSYKDLDWISTNIGLELKEKGINQNSLVAVVMEKGWEQVAAALGVLKAGAAYVPIDAENPTERINMLLNEGDINIVLTQKEIELEIRKIEVREILPVGIEYLYTPLKRLETICKPDETAYVIYTSGSTGKPKGVVMSHRAAINTILDINQRFNVTAEDCVLALSNFNFDLSVYDVFGMLAVGGTIAIPNKKEVKNPEYWKKFIKMHEVTIWNSVPAFMKLLTETCSIKDDLLDTLRLVLLSGDWIPVELPSKIKHLFGKIEVVGLGGATEAAIWSNFYVCNQIDSEWQSIPYGIPLENQKYFVLNEQLEDCPTWVPGKLYIGGIGLAKGYYKDEKMTASKFIYHPITGERLYQTGDLGRYWPDGNIEFLGREDSQVKINGYRIEIGEVEENIRNLERVKDVVIVPIGGKKNKHLVAFIVPEETYGIIGEKRECLWENLIRPIGKVHNATKYTDANEKLELMDIVSTNTVYKVLEQMGLYQFNRLTIGIKDCMQALGIVEKYEGLFRHWIKELISDGYAVYQDSAHITFRLPDELRTKLATNTELVKKIDNGREVADLEKIFFKEVQTYVEMLSMEKNLLELYIDNNSILLPHVLQQYLGNGDSDFNVFQTVFKSVLKTQTKKSLAILEIGTRVDTMGKKIKELLPSESRYIYADESLYFLEEKEQEISAKERVEFLQINLGDIEVPMQLKNNNFNIILSSNALHRFANIDTLLRNLRKVLDDYGMLVFTENVNNSRTMINTIGVLEEGFTRYTDERKNTCLPLLNKDEWEAALKRAGFEKHAIFVSDSGTSILGIALAEQRMGGKILEKEEILAELKQKLPQYMIPTQFLELDSIPLTANGKIDYRLLEKLAMGNMLEEVTITQEPPQSDMEKVLARIWKETLKVSEVYRDSEFFSLGGDSLTAIQCVNKIKSETGIEISLKTFYAESTLKNIANQIGQTAEEYDEGII